MISVDRERKENGRMIRPAADWFRRASEATKRALAEKSDHEPDDHVYGADEVRAALEKLFHGKCAYCETNITAGFSWRVEHFRPKGRVYERKDHPGYYWLTYEWNNLYPSCELCNERRRDKPLYDDPRESPAQGKADHFPLLDETTRVMAPPRNKAAIYREHTLLIDPCYDEPEDYLTFGVDGQPASVDRNPYGESTITVLNLRRKRLRNRRLKLIKLVCRMMEEVRSHESAGRAQEAACWKEALEVLSSDDQEYAGVVRAIIRDPDAFGL